MCINYLRIEGDELILYWTNKCKDNNFRCPHCQNMIGNKNGQMPRNSKNHKIQMFNGQVKCVVCSTTVGYFPHKSKIGDEHVRQGVSAKILNNVEYVTPIDQEDFQ